MSKMSELDIYRQSRAMLDCYKIAVNKLDDYFEYAAQSADDASMVKSILTELTARLKELDNYGKLTK